MVGSFVTNLLTKNQHKLPMLCFPFECPLLDFALLPPLLTPPSHPELIYGCARTKQTNDNRALRQAVTSGKTHCISSWTTWPANRVKLLWDCGLVLPIMMPKLTTHLPFHYKTRGTISWVNQNVSRRSMVLSLHKTF